MDPSVYLLNCRVVNQFAEQFIKEVEETTDWKNADLDIVMDIGCGPGNSTHLIDEYFPNIKQLIGIDMDPGMIALAEEKNSKGKIKYHVANIMDKERLKEWKGRVSRIVSHFMLHRVEDQTQAIKNIFDLLEPSGEAALSFIIDGVYYSAIWEVLQMPKWAPILEPTNFVFPDGFLQDYDVAHYKRVFEAAGFSVPYCEIKSQAFSYQSDEECKNLLYSLHTLCELNEELIEEFKCELFDQFLKHGLRDKHGFPVHTLVILHAKLRKDVEIEGKS